MQFLGRTYILPEETNILVKLHCIIFGIFTLVKGWEQGDVKFIFEKQLALEKEWNLQLGSMRQNLNVKKEIVIT